jgi:hypothetical protein
MMPHVTYRSTNYRPEVIVETHGLSSRNLVEKIARDNPEIFRVKQNPLLPHSLGNLPLRGSYKGRYLEISSCRGGIQISTYYPQALEKVRAITQETLDEMTR